jgi:hypothetical protein
VRNGENLSDENPQVRHRFVRKPQVAKPLDAFSRLRADSPSSPLLDGHFRRLELGRAPKLESTERPGPPNRFPPTNERSLRGGVDDRRLSIESLEEVLRIGEGGVWSPAQPTREGDVVWWIVIVCIAAVVLITALIMDRPPPTGGRTPRRVA